MAGDCQNDASFAKCQMRAIGHPGDVVIYAARPRTAFAWHEQNFNQSATRWIFP